jgi:hypothetical protein
MTIIPQGEAREGIEPPPDLPADSALQDPVRSSRARAGWRAVTTRGRVAGLVALVAALLGAVTGWREWIGVAAALAVLLLAAVLMAVGRSSCAVELDLPRTRFVVGEPGYATIQVRNTSSRRMLPLRMELDVAGLAMTLPVPSLAGGAIHLASVALPTGARAVVELGPLRAVRGDVFGLIRRVVQWPVHRQVFVHPRTVRPDSSLPGYVHDLEGEESTKRTASDLSFHTLREYVPGDDRRFIHWKSSARNGTLQVREFVQSHRSLVAVVLSGSRADYHWNADGGRAAGGSGPADDVDDEPTDPLNQQPAAVEPDAGATTDDRAAGPDNGPGDAEFEVAVSCAASLVAELVRQHRDVITDAAGADIRGGSIDGVLDQFCAVEATPESPDLIFETRRVVRRNPRVSLVVLVFGSAVGAAQLRAAVRSCPTGASVLAVRARADSSPHPVTLTRSDGSSVVTVNDVDALPVALRMARAAP